MLTSAVPETIGSCDGFGPGIPVTGRSSALSNVELRHIVGDAGERVFNNKNLHGSKWQTEKKKVLNNKC